MFGKLQKNTLTFKFTTKFSFLIIFSLVFGFAFNNIQVFADRNFSLRYSVTDTADIMLVGNTLLKCSGSSGCDNALSGGTTVANQRNNNGHYMVNADVDSDASTFNSSSYTLNIPSGSQVLWAGLYWGAVSNNSNRNQIKFKSPQSNNYQTITASQLDTTGSSPTYQAFANVTNFVSGSGTYWGANMQTFTNVEQSAYIPHGGWSLSIIYKNSSFPLKNINVFDGLKVVGATTSINQTVSGFYVPASGPISAKVGMIAYDGDMGTGGDSFKINSTTMTNSLNPSTNFFNSTITSMGSHLTTKNPNYVNQLGFDIDTLDASSALSNGAASATLNFTSTSESYIPGMVYFATNVNEPKINLDNDYQDLNTGVLAQDDTVRYTAIINNTGTDSAINSVLVDPIPTNMSYVSGSLKFINNSNTTTNLTDSNDNDIGYYNSTNNTVNVNIGTIAANTTFKVIYDLKINTGLANTTSFNLQSTLNFTKQLANSNTSVSTDADLITSGYQPDIITLGDILPVGTCTNGNPIVTEGTNSGSSSNTNLRLCIAAGGLNIYAPETASLGELTISKGNGYAYTTLNDIVVEDLRGSMAGWTVNISLENLVLGNEPENSQNLILMGDKINTNSGANYDGKRYLTVNNKNFETIGGDDVSNLQQNYNPQFTTYQGYDRVSKTGSMANLAASVNTGAGAYRFDSDIFIEIPAFGRYDPTTGNKSVKTGNYTGKILFDVF
jgi:uncharacterized repeat protein (TIGR01451 family)